MKEMTINFIMNSVGDPHLNKRIDEFLQKGYKVRLYGFDRNTATARRDDVVIIGTFSNAMSYGSRLGIYIKGIRGLFRSLTDNEGIWYYQGLDVAMFATWFNPNKKYIYEECDLVHTNVGNKWLRSLLERIDKRIIRKAHRTVFTSEGFIDYHYGAGKTAPTNIVVVPNRLPACVLQQQAEDLPHSTDVSHLRFAFVGGLRYRSLVSIAKLIATNFPNHEFHFYGFVSPKLRQEELPKGENIFYHGAFKSPDDLPSIYSNIDVVVSTYDVASDNVRYAEPNKLYEAIFFRRPIVVSSGTFLAKKVERLGIGYSVNPYNEQEVVALVKEVESNYNEKTESLSQIPRTSAIEEDNIDLITR